MQGCPWNHPTARASRWVAPGAARPPQRQSAKHTASGSNLSQEPKTLSRTPWSVSNTWLSNESYTACDAKKHLCIQKASKHVFPSSLISLSLYLFWAYVNNPNEIIASFLSHHHTTLKRIQCCIKFQKLWSDKIHPHTFPSLLIVDKLGKKWEEEKAYIGSVQNLHKLSVHK